jgi:hypothetical protein
MTLKVKLAIALISLAPLVTTGAQAMTVEDFGRMNNDDEATFVTLLIESSAQMLKAHGQPDEASKLIAYFKVPGKFGGVQQLAEHIKAINAINKRHAINPNNRAPVYQIEDAMESTLKDQGFLVPAKYLLDSMKDFHPAGLPRQHAFVD